MPESSPSPAATRTLTPCGGSSSAQLIRATNLVYDVDFYLKTPQNAQALEFDANQANGHMRWIFGTQCNIALRSLGCLGQRARQLDLDRYPLQDARGVQVAPLDLGI